MSKQKGRKALIILSDGVDSGSKENLVKSIEAAQRADTIVYAIYFKGEEHQQQDNRGGQRGGRGGGYPGGGGIGFPGGRGGGYPGGGGGGYPGGGGNGGNRQPSGISHADGKKTLERMAQETGGRLFEVSRKQTVADIYTQIAEELRAQYRLGYTPDQATAASRLPPDRPRTQAEGPHRPDPRRLLHRKLATVPTLSLRRIPLHASS